MIKELFLKKKQFFLVLPSPSGRNFGTSLDHNIITQDDDDGNGDEDKRCLGRVQRWWSDILDTSIPGIAHTGFHFLIKKKIAPFASNSLSCRVDPEVEKRKIHKKNNCAIFFPSWC